MHVGRKTLRVMGEPGEIYWMEETGKERTTIPNMSQKKVFCWRKIKPTCGVLWVLC